MPPIPSQASRKGSNRKPRQKATVIKTADQGQPQNVSNVDRKILERIQKCLDRAHHANSSESEAKAALFISQKLMSQHNVTQADLLASDQSNSKAHFGGCSKVLITKTDGSGKRIMMEAFASKLALAMCTFFDCKSFSTHRRESVEWSFFGIASNTVAAAMSFEMAHNQILDWACVYKGGTPTFSYRLGVADGIAAMANRERKRELDQVQRKELEFLACREREEAENRRREFERLRLLPAPSTDLDTLSNPDYKCLDPADLKAEVDSDFDNETDDAEDFGTMADFNADDMEIIDLCDDVNESINRFVKREPTEPLPPTDIPAFDRSSETSIKIKSETESIPPASPWESGAQLVQFRATAEQVADDYLKENKIKLTHRKSRQSTIRDFDAYRQGQKDSSKIEISRQAQG